MIIKIDTAQNKFKNKTPDSSPDSVVSKDEFEDFSNKWCGNEDNEDRLR